MFNLTVKRMEPKGTGESGHTAPQVRCKKIPSDAGRPSDAPKNEQGQESSSIASATPEKSIHPPRTKSKERVSRSCGKTKLVLDTDDDTRPSADGPSSNERELSSALVIEPDLKYSGDSPVDKVMEIPEKYKTIVEFFDCVECSVRLLCLRKKLPTFRNISTQVEVMTKRKFLYGHLAQIKYLFPEAVMVEKIRVHDKNSLCMVPDLKISFSLDAQHLLQNKSPSLALRQTFCSRLLNFDHAHPEHSNIPEALLPEPFNQNDQAAGLCDELLTESLPELSSDADSLLCASHFPSDFGKHFSQKLVPEKQNAQLLLSTSLAATHNDAERLEEINFPSGNNDPVISKAPLESISDMDCSISLSCENTPAKHKPAPSKMVVETPVLQTPKLSMGKSSSVKSDIETEIKERPSARKSLRFLPTNEDLASNLKMEDGVITGSKEKDQVICHMVPEHSRNQQMLAALPDLFNTIRSVFQSAKSCSMTKQELVHKILFHHYDIEETSEVEEQLQLLETLVPDWIRGRTASSGDFLYSVEKSFDPETIRARIIQAL